MSKQKSLGLALCLVACGVATTPAMATTYAGHRSDPADYRSGPSRDVERVSTTFDDQAGRWTVRVVFYARPGQSTIAKVYLGLTLADLGSCQGSGGPAMRLSIKGTSVSGGYALSCLPPGTGVPTVEATRTGRVVSATVVDPQLIGARATAGTASRVSQSNRYFDTVAGFKLAER